MNIRFTRKKVSRYLNFSLPGDKSIAHRSLIIGALGKGKYLVKNYPDSLDCQSTLECMKSIGVKIEMTHDGILVNSPGYKNFNRQAGYLNANNSGTTARLLCGLVAGCGISAIIDGDESLRKRPMERIIKPLTAMEADLHASQDMLPINIYPSSRLKSIKYTMPVSSAQVKSCLLIAGFMAEGETEIIEKDSTRDHTERMFEYLGADIRVFYKNIKIKNSLISVADMVIPGDISSAAFLIASTLLSEDSELRLDDILLNERRRKYLDILKCMGANLDYIVSGIYNGEDIGYITVRSSQLNGIKIRREQVPDIIDEIPVISVLAAFSSGVTVIEGIEELKYKESNRIRSVIENLRIMGVSAQNEEDSLTIEGNDLFINKNISFESFNDHRIALSFAAAAQRNLGETIIKDWDCTAISFPGSLNYFKEFLNIDYLL